MAKKSIDPARIEFLPLSQLLPYPKNPRTHPKANVDKLAASLTEYGWTNPVLITDKLEVIAGHGRLLAARQLKIDAVPCIRLKHLSEAQVRAYRLADNRLGLDSDWDLELLAAELRELDLDNLLTGFDPDELDRILNSDASREGEDDTPTLQEVAVSKPGEIWALGPHRLICADACSAAEVVRLLGGVTPSVMITDPPYGIELDSTWRNNFSTLSGTRMFGLERQTAKPDNDHQSHWSAAYNLFAGSVIYVWHAAWHASEVENELLSNGFKIRSQIIWAKQHLVLSRGHYHWQHECCWYAVREGHNANWHGDRTQTTIWEIQNLNPMGGNRKEVVTGHSTQKPVELMRRPMVNHTSTGQAVYDPFMGSGTTIIAAETIGRVCYGVEINPLYVDMAIRRWQTFTGKKATCDGRTFPERENSLK